MPDIGGVFVIMKPTVEHESHQVKVFKGKNSKIWVYVKGRVVFIKGTNVKVKV